MRSTSRLLAAMAILTMACSDESSSDPEELFGPPTEPGAEADAPSGVTVLTRNVYVGTDVDAVIGALQTPDPTDDLPTLIAAIETLRRTDFPSRAAAFASEIARARPHVVGLQEVSQVDLLLPPLGVDVHLDFLPALLAELAARGLDYAVAAQVRNIDAQPIPGVSLVDYDAILVDRRRVRLLETNAGSFAANLGEVTPGVVLRRGWVMAKGVVQGITYTFASTHLESGQLPGLDQLRAAQAGELAVTEVLLAAAEEKAIVLAVDDAHWLDRESVLTLGAALRDLHGSPFSVTLAIQPRWSRPEIDEIRSHIGRDLGGAAVSLPPLGREALRALATHFLPNYSEVELDRLIRRVATDSAGVPFLAVEVLRAVAHGLDLGSVSGTWPEPFRTLDQTLPGDLPDTVVAALRVTFRLLTARAQSVLAAMSVIGDHTELDMLSSGTGLSPGEIEAALDELESHQWLAVDARGYAFTARMSREVISRDMVTRGQRRRILEAARDGAWRSNPGEGSLV